MQTILTMTIFDAFVESLKNFDWYYDYSDDIKVYRRGKDRESHIRGVMAGYPLLQEAYSAFSTCAHSGGEYHEKLRIRNEKIAQLREQLATQLFFPMQEA